MELIGWGGAWCAAHTPPTDLREGGSRYWMRRVAESGGDARFPRSRDQRGPAEKGRFRCTSARRRPSRRTRAFGESWPWRAWTSTSGPGGTRSCRSRTSRVACETTRSRSFATTTVGASSSRSVRAIPLPNVSGCGPSISRTNVDNSGFVGWLATHIKRATGSGVFVVCGQNSCGGGIYDHWGCPEAVADPVLETIHALAGRRPEDRGQEAAGPGGAG